MRRRKRISATSCKQCFSDTIRKSDSSSSKEESLITQVRDIEPSLRHKSALVVPKYFPPIFGNYLGQPCTTYGLRAKCGQLNLLIWPAKPNMLCIQLICLIETHIKWVKHINFGHRTFQKIVPQTIEKFMTPKMFEKGTPGHPRTIFVPRSCMVQNVARFKVC